MASKLFVDLDTLDLDKIEYGMEEIRKVVPQRYEMEMLHGIIKYDPQNNVAVGFRDIGEDEFWVEGHIPGRPLFPGVLMIEAAAQLSTFYYKTVLQDDPSRFLGFGGVDDIKFRGTVVPGDRLILISKNTELKRRRAIFDTQAVVNGKLVFEGIIIGMPI